MQPTMVITAVASGMIYINGHFSGECSADMPLMRPVNPVGAVYIEYRPLDSARLPMACRLVFSGGYPLPESAEAAQEIRIVAWPGSITEIELLPRKSEPDAPILFEAGGRGFVIDSQRRLRLEGRTLMQLPDDAEIPECRRSGTGTVLIGQSGDGMYLAALDAQMQNCIGFLQAKRIEAESDGRIRAMVDRGDVVGHASLESWRLEPEGLVMISSEPAWVDGAPRWPKTALETVCAAIEAEMAGLHSEAEGYLSPALRKNAPLAALAERCVLCTEMKYALPDGRPCAALIQLEGGAMARAEALYYHVSASGGAQGPYQIESLGLE